MKGKTIHTMRCRHRYDDNTDVNIIFSLEESPTVFPQLSRPSRMLHFIVQWPSSVLRANTFFSIAARAPLTVKSLTAHGISGPVLYVCVPYIQVRRNHPSSNVP